MVLFQLEVSISATCSGEKARSLKDLTISSPERYFVDLARSMVTGVITLDLFGFNRKLTPQEGPSNDAQRFLE